MCQQRACTRSTAIYIYPRDRHRARGSVVTETNFQVIVKNIHTFDGKNAADFIEWYEKFRIILNIYDKAASRVLQGAPVPSAAIDTDASKLAAWNTTDEDLHNVPFFTTKGAACSVVHRLHARDLTRAQDTSNARGPSFAKRSTAVRGKHSERCTPR